MRRADAFRSDVLAPVLEGTPEEPFVETVPDGGAGGLIERIVFIFTNEIAASDLAGRAANVQVAPGIYQELVEKKAEWRVTVVGNNLFPVRIDSQKSPETAVDWRRNQLADMYDLAELDPELGRKLLKVHEQLGLIYGAYDLIERPDGEMVFLECNPAGQ